VLLSVLIVACSGGEKTVKLENPVVIERTKELRKVVRENITDDEKQASLLKLIDEAAVRGEKFSWYYEGYQEAVKELSADYEADENQFKELLDPYNKQFEEFILAMVVNRAAMRDLVTDEEWDRLEEHISFFSIN